MNKILIVLTALLSCCGYIVQASEDVQTKATAAIRGRGHLITFSRAAAPTPEPLRPNIVGYPMRFDFLCVNYPEVPEGYLDHFANIPRQTAIGMPR